MTITSIRRDIILVQWHTGCGCGIYSN